jgi:hypothetical protein
MEELSAGRAPSLTSAADGDDGGAPPGGDLNVVGVRGNSPLNFAIASNCPDAGFGESLYLSANTFVFPRGLSNAKELVARGADPLFLRSWTALTRRLGETSSSSCGGLRWTLAWTLTWQCTHLKMKRKKTMIAGPQRTTMHRTQTASFVAITARCTTR